jgi:hypothetical protein
MYKYSRLQMPKRLQTTKFSLGLDCVYNVCIFVSNKTKKKMKRINFYIPSDLLEKARARAEEMNLNSLAALVRLAITEYLKK